ncbi:Appr-1-p processing protein [Chitinophaga oryziterrae]|uniref:Appr-1-p processing protein n=1 Tax=Chitinophaga oryziterrae TaxID=1031224 RepID=A0A6N8JF31_9BACT|nr:macro domain-containing protein [Chitinophaga oryziterrae]MVT42986.1 Appr-1-p processing protein [Chitinophaga oryziterrae]
MRKEIKYIKGDATKPDAEGCVIIAHICNDIGRWGKGFVLALSDRWEQPETEFREWYKSQDNFKLGEVQFVEVENNIWIANIIGQHKIVNDKKGNPPVRYEAIEAGLNKVGDFARNLNATVHMPRIGCGLAGGKWEIIEPLIIKGISDNDIEVTVYDLE